MFTWGLLATAMMFVRTPLEFNILRFLLGVAEAGFFPGVLYYLTLWFPAGMRARAVSRFYIALPLSSTLMGSLAGWLLSLWGKFGLAGWQWLFLLEGLPSVLFSGVILWALPDGPGKAKWLTADEKAWLQRQLEADGARAHLGHGAGVREALLSPKVWRIGLFFFCALTCSYAYQFSAPAMLQAATGWNVAKVGYLVAGFGVAGALAMLLNGAHSDRLRERRMHCVIPCVVMAAAFLDRRLRGLGMAYRDGSGTELCGVHVHAGTRARGSHGVPRRARGGRGDCGHEHHHHVQWIRGAVLDGTDEGSDRKLPGGAARAGIAQPVGGRGDVGLDAKPGAASRGVGQAGGGVGLRAPDPLTAPAATA